MIDIVIEGEFEAKKIATIGHTKTSDDSLVKS